MRIDAVEAGDDCAHGGYRVNAGVDANANGVLDDVEITETALACASADGQPGAPGSDGSNGNNGANGTSAVLGSEPIVPGAECVNGGTRMNAGLDLNGNGVLDEAEISASVAVCSTAVKQYVQIGELALPVGFATNDMTVYASAAAASDTNGDGYPDIASDGDVVAVFAWQVNNSRLIFFERVGAGWVEINQISSPGGLSYVWNVVGFTNRIMVVTGQVSPGGNTLSYVIEKVGGVYAVTDLVTSTTIPNGINLALRGFDGEHILVSDSGWGNGMAMSRKIAGAPLPQATPLLMPPGHTPTGFATAFGRGRLAISTNVAGVHGLSTFSVVAGAQTYLGRIPMLLNGSGYPAGVAGAVVGASDVLLTFTGVGVQNDKVTQVWRYNAGGAGLGMAQTLSHGAYISAPVLDFGAQRLVAQASDPTLGYFPAVYNLVDGFWQRVQTLSEFAGTGVNLTGAALLAGGEELYVSVTGEDSLRLYAWQ